MLSNILYSRRVIFIVPFILLAIIVIEVRVFQISLLIVGLACFFGAFIICLRDIKNSKIVNIFFCFLCIILINILDYLTTGMGTNWFNDMRHEMNGFFKLVFKYGKGTALTTILIIKLLTSIYVAYSAAIFIHFMKKVKTDIKLDGLAFENYSSLKDYCYERKQQFKNGLIDVITSIFKKSSGAELMPAEDNFVAIFYVYHFASLNIIGLLVVINNFIQIAMHGNLISLYVFILLLVLIFFILIFSRRIFFNILFKKLLVQ